MAKSGDWKKGLSKKAISKAKKRGRKWAEGAGYPPANKRGPKKK